MNQLKRSTEINQRVRPKVHHFVFVDFGALHMLHDKLKQVGLGRRTVCACFVND